MKNREVSRIIMSDDKLHRYHERRLTVSAESVFPSRETLQPCHSRHLEQRQPATVNIFIHS